MWFWKKRKPEQAEEKNSASRSDQPMILMGLVARPTPPADKRQRPEPERPDIDPGGLADEPPKQKQEEDGTSRAASTVGGGMEQTTSPRPNAFDPSKAAASTLIPLQSVQIATPCRADWSKMEGDHKSRFCQTCQKSVYNLSSMTASEAQALILEKEGNLCARIYRRADGTMITGDCPVGTTVSRRPFWGAFASILAAIGCGGLLSGCIPDGTSTQASGPSLSMRWADTIDKARDVPVVGAVVNKVSPVSVVAGGISALVAPVMGKIACPKPTATPAPTATPEPDGSPEMGEAAVRRAAGA